MNTNQNMDWDMDRNMEKQIAFDRIKEMWSELTLTEWARKQIAAMTFYTEEDRLRKALKDTTDARALMEKQGMPPLQSVTEVREILLAAEKGVCLMPEQLERVEKILTVIGRLKQYLNRGKADGNPLAWYEENLSVPQELREEINRQIRCGAVDDHASAELQQIRNRMAVCEEQRKRKAEQVMRSRQRYMSDTFCTFKNGRICVPVKKEYRHKIEGSVVDQSASGSTVFLEPAGAAKFYEELQLLEISEENEKYRILYTLTAMVDAAAAVIREDIVLMEKLDFIMSKGKLSMDMKASAPSVNSGRRIVLTDARHPLMDPAVHVPLQFQVGEETRGIVITGPNTGGKTVAIKTVMLNCMMAQCGLHVTCREAEICMNSSYLCDIGDGQDMTANLSTFSAHIKHVLAILRATDKDSFVILDELGSGTDPAEGMGIAVAILEELRKSGALFLATTHYPEVKEYAEQAKGMINARMTFDRETLRPTYQMVMGEAGESCAFYIADRLGMPEDMLKTAVRAAYGETAVGSYRFVHKEKTAGARGGSRLVRHKREQKGAVEITYQRGDSVMIYPDRKLGIVFEPANEKGMLRVQLPDRKIWINHKRVKLQVAATQLYPEDYDFSIIFDMVANRKIRHDMERKYTEETIEYAEE